MRRTAEKHTGWRLARSLQFLDKLKTLGLRCPLLRIQVMGLVDDEHVPLGCLQQAFVPSFVVGPQGRQRRDDDLMDTPKVRLLGIQVRVVHSSPNVEHLLEALLPLLNQFGRGKYQKSLNGTVCQERPQDQACFDGLPHANIVRNEQPDRPGLECEVTNPQLVRQE